MQRSKVRFIESSSGTIPIHRAAHASQPQFGSMFRNSPHSGAIAKIPLIEPATSQSLFRIFFQPVCEFFHQYFRLHDHGMGVVQS